MIINVSNWFQHVLGLIPQGQPQGNVTSCILAKCVGPPCCKVHPWDFGVWGY